MDPDQWTRLHLRPPSHLHPPYPSSVSILSSPLPLLSLMVEHLKVMAASRACLRILISRACLRILSDDIPRGSRCMPLENYRNIGWLMRMTYIMRVISYFFFPKKREGEKDANVAYQCSHLDRPPFCTSFTIWIGPIGLALHRPL